VYWPSAGETGEVLRAQNTRLVQPKGKVFEKGKQAFGNVEDHQQSDLEVLIWPAGQSHGVEQRLQ